MGASCSLAALPLSTARAWLATLMRYDDDTIASVLEGAAAKAQAKAAAASARALSSLDSSESEPGLLPRHRTS